MALSTDDINALIWRVEALTHAREAVFGGVVKGEQVELCQQLHAMKAELDAIKAKTDKLP